MPPEYLYFIVPYGLPKARFYGVATLSRYLQGVREPELKYVVRLARYFGVSVDWLLGLSNDRYEAVPSEVREFATLYALASPDDRTIVETVLKKYREEN